MSVSLDQGYTRRAQCVPCGAYHKRDDGSLTLIGYGWKSTHFGDPEFDHPAYRDPKTDGGAGETPPAASAVPLDPAAPADRAHGAPAPSSPRRFLLDRHQDVTGQSGTGPVVEGARWTDGTVSIRWRGGNPSFANWPDVESLLAVHGHGGATELVWLDGEERACRVCGCTDEAACSGGCYWVAEDLCSQCGGGAGVPS